MECIQLLRRKRPYKSDYIDYIEVISDCHIPGNLEYKNITFKALDWNRPNPFLNSNLYSYILTIKSKPLKIYKETERNFHGIEHELAVLFSLFLRKRFYIIGKIGDYNIKKENLSLQRSIPKFTFVKKYPNEIAPEIFTVKNEKLSDLTNWLNLIKKLPKEWQKKYLLAASCYAEGLKLINIYPHLAYIQFISAIEALVGEDIPPIVTSLMNRPDIKSVIKNLKKEKKEEEHEILLNIKYYGSTKKFITFVEKYSTNFLKENEENQYTKISKSNLKKYLKKGKYPSVTSKL